MTERPAADRPEMPPKVRTALVAALTLVLGIAAGAFLWSGPSDALPSPVTLFVPGAINIHVYCGGASTFMTDRGEHDSLDFAPDGASCDVEASLSPVMPLRGSLQLGASARYRCVRQGVDLICGADPAPVE